MVTFSNRLILSLALVLGLLLVGCDSADPDTETGSVSGIVMAANGTSPVPGATVTLASAATQRPAAGALVVQDAPSAVTDSDGQFVLDGLPPGTQDLQARRGNFTSTFDVTIEAGATATAPQIMLAPERPLAYIHGPFDAMQDIVADDGYVIEQVPANIFEDPADAAPYGIIFLNCNTNLAGSSAEVITPNARQWMEAGGTLYVSDLSGSTANALVDGFDSGTGGTGSQAIAAEITLDEILLFLDVDGAVDVVYDQNNWFRIMETPPSAITLLEGTRQGQSAAEPLAVAIPYGDGRLVFTTFHNTVNATDQMLALLRYFMYLG